MQRKLILLILSLLLTGPCFGAQFDGSIPQWKKDQETFKKPEENFKKAMHLLLERYVDQGVKEEDLYRAAAEGMFAALNTGKENWNTVLSPRKVEDTHIQMSGEVVGIGATLDFDDVSKSARIRALIPNSAAEKAGLKVLDQILRVDGKRYEDLPSMVMHIRGTAGSFVKLKILRDDRIMDVSVTRAAVKIPMVMSGMVDEKTGYLEINEFTENLLPDLKKAMALFDQKHLTKLILDLRNDNGGLFEKLIDVSNVFLRSGDIIVKTKSRNGEVKAIQAKGQNWSPETKIVVLVNGATSSSAEVLAAALKENRGAVLVGVKTAGKWTVESLDELPNGFYVKYSIMSMMDAKDRSYEGKGLTPDFEIVETKEKDLMGTDFLKDLKARAAKDTILKAAIEYPIR